MAHYDLEEQEQIDSLKTWWKMYGNLVTAVLTAVALAGVGWQGWQWYKNNQSAKAAAIYAVLEQAVAANDGQKIRTAAGELAEKFGGTGYAGLAALQAARHSFESGDLKTAKAQLSWAADNGRDEIRDLARLRLANVLLDEQAYDEALKRLEAAPTAAFAARFNELRGDVLVAQGQPPAARKAYQAALDTLSGKSGPGRELLQQKLDQLGGAA
ncbi:MAG: tetratricopeptide repeat protein [Dechloromonas sp.]|nr:tetratricopeptide repeat protein [Dechloromonas sp.]